VKKANDHIVADPEACGRIEPNVTSPRSHSYSGSRLASTPKEKSVQNDDSLIPEVDGNASATQSSSKKVPDKRKDTASKASTEITQFGHRSSRSKNTSKQNEVHPSEENEAVFQPQDFALIYDGPGGTMYL